MKQFLQTFVGSLAAKLLAGIALAFLALLGFGSDYWVGLFIRWASDPLGLSLNAARLVFILAGIVLVASLMLPTIKRRLWPAPVHHVESVNLAAGMTPQTTAPVLLIANAKGGNDKLQIVVEYSSFHRSLGWAGWLKPRQVLLQNLQDVIEGQQIRVPVVTCNADASEVWWGGANDSPGNLIQKSTKYRAKLKLIGDEKEEQCFRFCLLRTSLTEAPYIVEVFTEVDLDIV
ncbi:MULTISPECIES: hypothetical protein [Bradyrhizobium]|uniref:hypothetical protein n=1 Tax=Bradyrhizobium elkanii TaxID=29448 RepID=UPI000489C522|nr:hypothetical protein [Bradyrhizobium elkanii]